MTRTNHYVVALILGALLVPATLACGTTLVSAPAAVVGESSNTATSDSASNATVSGRVLDANGKPVANASMSLVLWSYQPDRDRRPAPPTTVWSVTKSDADGHYELKYTKVGEPEFYVKRAFRLTAIARSQGHGLGWQFIDFAKKSTVADISLPEE